MESKSDQVHTIWMTSSYGMGAVVFSPNDYFSPNSQQRWVGLIFSDFNHTALGMPHLTGEKWGIVDEDIMLLQRCGNLLLVNICEKIALSFAMRFDPTENCP